MKCVRGTFNGTGAALYIGCGFIPTRVEVRAVGDAGGLNPRVKWSSNDRVAAQAEGVLDTDMATQAVQLAAGEGISAYAGGDILTAALQTDTTYGGGIYLVRDEKDYRYGTNAMPGPNGGSGDAVATTIDTWTLDTSANRTGHFNEDVTGTYIGAGSKITIETGYGKLKIHEDLFIEALTATQGEAADEVTLNRAVGAGRVRKITGMYDFAPQAVGQIILPGFKISATTHINVDGEMQEFVAYLDDE